MFSKSCEYGLQALIYISLHSDTKRKVGLKEIAENQEIPLHFLSKILQLVVKHKLIGSMKGPNGGFYFVKSPLKITLMDIVKMIDSTDIFDRCGIGLKACSDKNPCPIHHEFKLVKEQIKQVLANKTLDELSHDIKQGNSIISFKSKKQIK